MHRLLPIIVHTLRLPLAVAVVLGLAFASLPAPSLAATTITVSTTADELNSDGDCALREAVRAANLDRAVDRCPAGSGADTITVPAGTYATTREGQEEDDAVTGDLDLKGSVAIVGAGRDRTIVDGQSVYDRVFDVAAGADVSISNVTIQNGFYDSDGGSGVFNRGTLTILDSRITRNRGAYRGGGIFSQGTLTIKRSTIESNFASEVAGALLNEGKATIEQSVISGNGSEEGGIGAILNTGTGRLMITDSEISRNVGSDEGAGLRTGGVYNGGIAIITNSTISDNSGAGITNSGTLTINSSNIVYNRGTFCGDLPCQPRGIITIGDGLSMSNSIVFGNALGDCQGTINSLGYNIIATAPGCTIAGDRTGNQLNVDPRLGPLADNGGPTRTHALPASSPAVDAGSLVQPGDGATACAVLDQRGTLRPYDGNRDGTARCDIGAFELTAPPAFNLNGTFEADANNDGSPDGWSVDPLATRSRDVARGGRYSLRFRASGNRDARVYQVVAGLTAGTNYQAAGWANIPPTSDRFSFSFGVAWKDAAGKELRVDTIKTWTGATGGWQQATAQLRAPTGTDHAVVRLVATSLAATVYVDDVSFRPR